MSDRSYSQIAKIVGKSKAYVVEGVENVEHEIRSANPYYLIPYIARYLDIFGADVVKEYFGEKRLAFLKEYLEAVEKRINEVSALSDRPKTQVTDENEAVVTASDR